MSCADHDRRDGTDEEQFDAVETIERYEVEDGTVFYDARNPLAWVQSSTSFVLREQV